MTGFPKNSTDLLNFIQKRKQEGLISHNKDIHSFLNAQTQNYVSAELSVQKQEEWKYFPIQKLITTDYLFSEDLLKSQSVTQKPYVFPNPFKILVQDGEISFSHIPKGLQIFLWKDFLKDSISMDSQLKSQVHTILKKERNRFCSLNNILSLNGFFLVITQDIKEFIEIQYVHSRTDKNKGMNIRNFIFVQNNSSAQILETFYGSESQKEASFFFNLQTDCVLESQCQIKYFRLDQGQSQNIQMNQLFVSMDKESQGHFLTLNFGSELSRYLTSIIQKKESNSKLSSLSLLGEKKQANHKVMIRHQEKSTSDQFYKSLLFDSSKHIFNGVIYMDKEAQKTSAHQLNKNLLFGKKSFAVSCPELNIQPDDVTAVHGATVSSIETKNDMFLYLQSRGLNKEQSYHFVLSGIIRDVLSSLDDKTFSYFEPLIWKHLNTLQSQSGSVQ